MSIAAIHHILLDERGRAHIAGSRVKVMHLVMEMQAYGWSAEELHEQHPHLPRAAIYAALAYYYDHQAELDQQIAEDFRQAEAQREAAGPSPLAQRLRAEGRLQ
jgi:uncharacterized protein (DUF433 family)